jgi:stage III sporulation protein AH
MMVFKRKQIVVLSLVLMIVVAGYVQYSYKSSSTTAGKNSAKLGEAVYVDNNASADTKKNDEKKSPASKESKDFFNKARDNQDQATFALEEIINDTTATKEAKAKAWDDKVKLVENKKKEVMIETFIKEKGFSDAIAIFAEDGSIDVVVETPSLDSAKVAKIVNIVTKQTKLGLDKITISNKY